MTNKILKAILSVASAVLITCLVIITGAMYQYFGSVQQTQLKDELRMAVRGTEEFGTSYLEDLDSANYRLTLVAKDGTVLYDSQAEADEMENHADRKEIKDALVSGSGSSSRYSATLTEQYIYEAVRLEDGSVLRISESRVTAVVLVLGMMQPIALLILVVLGVSIWLADRMAKRIVQPLNRLDLDRPMENDAYEELSPLLCRLHSQQLEIKRQMQALKQKQEEFVQITGNMKEALILLDQTGRIVSINPAAEKLFGSENSRGMDFLTVDRKRNMQAALEEVKAKGTSSVREKKNGREYQFELSCIHSEGKLVGIVILGFDITEQVNAEQSRREFTANVSHELKTPLQSIIGSAELLENGIVKQDDIPRFVGHIRKESARLINLIDDIIRLSQLDEEDEMPQEEVSLHVLSEEICETLSDAAKIRQVDLEITGEDGVIQGVRRLLYEIIYNLCDNAIKYNHLGGKVTISIEENQYEICLKVEDTGIGIALEDQEKIFERFYRVDKSHSKQSGGTGLGLSIVKHAVQYHHGKILVESELGKGTAISVLFPIR